MSASHKVVFLDRASLKATVRKPAQAESYVEHEKTSVDELVAKLKGATVAITIKVPLRGDVLKHLPELKIRVVNVVDLMRLQPRSEHPHGMSDTDFDELFTKDKPVIFAFHAYPWLIHRLTYRRTNHDNIHVRGYKEEGTITTPFDMRVQNDLDRFHLVMDVVD